MKLELPESYTSRLKAGVCKEFSFDAAHRLPHHNGKCFNLHGHTYKLKVWAQGPIQPITGKTDEGMIVDFDRIKQVYKDVLEPRLDHKFLNETVPVPVTTAEMLASWVLYVYTQFIPEVYKVRVYETPTSYAEVERR